MVVGRFEFERFLRFFHLLVLNLNCIWYVYGFNFFLIRDDVRKIQKLCPVVAHCEAVVVSQTAISSRRTAE